MYNIMYPSLTQPGTWQNKWRENNTEQNKLKEKKEEEKRTGTQGEKWRQTKEYRAIREEEAKDDEVIKRNRERKKNRSRKIKCLCREEHETIRMGKTARGKEGMSCNRDRRGKERQKRARRGGNWGQGRMRCRTMIDRFLAGSICHTVIGRKME